MKANFFMSVQYLYKRQLLCWYEGWDGSVTIFLTSKIHKVWSNGELLTRLELRETEFCGHVFIGHLISHSPSHVHNLETKTTF